MLSVSVVVPVRNAARTLPSCLGALEKLRPSPEEVILVDNGSTDDSLAFLRAFARSAAGQNVRVLTELRRGATCARNAGVRVAKGQLLAFTDADCVPAPTWLLHLTEPFTDPAVGAVAGRVVAAQTTSTLELFSALYTLQSQDHPSRHSRWTPWEGGYPTANLAIRRRLVEDLSGFDESIGIYGEDYDLCARLYARGSVIVYTPEARVSHSHRTTVAGLLRQAFGFGRGHPYLLRRHAAYGLWLDLPKYPLAWNGCPIRAWVDLASADKKVLGILLLGAMYRPFFLLFPFYLGWLAVAASCRARRSGSFVSVPDAFGLAGLLLLKSAAMTAGRWWGSLKYGTICI